jgi:hypothetical protein
MHARLTEADPGLATFMQRPQIQRFALADPILYVNPPQCKIYAYAIAELSSLYRNLVWMLLLLIMLLYVQGTDDARPAQIGSACDLLLL